MHIVKVIAGGLALLAVFLLIARLAGGGSRYAAALRLFIPVWLVAALVNMWVGVMHAGYGWGEEAPIFVLIFAACALPAYVLLRRFSRSALI